MRIIQIVVILYLLFIVAPIDVYANNFTDNALLTSSYSISNEQIAPAGFYLGMGVVLIVVILILGKLLTSRRKRK